MGDISGAGGLPCGAPFDVSRIDVIIRSFFQCLRELLFVKRKRFSSLLLDYPKKECETHEADMRWTSFPDCPAVAGVSYQFRATQFPDYSFDDKIAFTRLTGFLTLPKKNLGTFRVSRGVSMST